MSKVKEVSPVEIFYARFRAQLKKSRKEHVCDKCHTVIPADSINYCLCWGRGLHSTKSPDYVHVDCLYPPCTYCLEEVKRVEINPKADVLLCNNQSCSAYRRPVKAIDV